MLILWCIGLPMIMNPANFIAVGSTQIVNGNLYVASWVCFGSIIFLVGDMLGDVFAGPQGASIGLSRLDPETGEYVTTAPFTTVHYKRLWETRRGKWFALAAITGVALSATVLTFQSLCKSEMVQTYASNSTCIDSKVAIAMMVLGGIISLVMLGIGSIGGSLAEYLEKMGAVTTTIVWTIGLGVITFGDGPVSEQIQCPILWNFLFRRPHLSFSTCGTFCLVSSLSFLLLSKILPKIWQ